MFKPKREFGFKKSCVELIWSKWRWNK